LNAAKGLLAAFCDIDARKITEAEGTVAMIDNASLLIGIAFSSASLMVALLIGWLNSRHETYLVHGAAGIAFVVVGVALLGLRNGQFGLAFTLLPYALILSGLALIYSASRLFRNPRASLRPAAWVGITLLVIMTVPFLLGLSGVGTIVLNLAAALIMLLCAREYWMGRDDARIAMLANVILYSVTAISFLACAIVLLVEAQWVLTAPADNWAEDFNSIMSLVGLTGIGAITLTLHHARAARRHHAEANTDVLTGVLNRRALFSQYRDEDVIAGLAVVMFDLDHFKQINDRYGHARGDLVLQQFAGVMKSQLRAADVMARLGGEEFCVILPGLDREAAHSSAERIRKAYAALQIPVGEPGHTATVSAGLAIGSASETFASALSRADAALYKAKSAGRNQVFMASLRLVA
jgi:diguanylate cyclase (GGDEF)-like protein